MIILYFAFSPSQLEIFHIFQPAAIKFNHIILSCKCILNTRNIYYTSYEIMPDHLKSFTDLALPLDLRDKLFRCSPDLPSLPPSRAAPSFSPSFTRQINLAKVQLFQGTAHLVLLSRQIYLTKCTFWMLLCNV